MLFICYFHYYFIFTRLKEDFLRGCFFKYTTILSNQILFSHFLSLPFILLFIRIIRNSHCIRFKFFSLPSKIPRNDVLNIRWEKRQAQMVARERREIEKSSLHIITTISLLCHCSFCIKLFSRSYKTFLIFKDYKNKQCSS